MPNIEEIREKIIELTQERGSDKTICPSEVARAIETDEDKWRRLMKPIRREAFNMARDGAIVIKRKGKIQNPFEEIKGVIRLGMPDPSG